MLETELERFKNTGVKIHLSTKVTPQLFSKIEADVYNSDAEFLEKKNLFSHDGARFIIEWLRQYYDKENKHLAYHILP